MLAWLKASLSIQISNFFHKISWDQFWVIWRIADIFLEKWLFFHLIGSKVVELARTRKNRKGLLFLLSSIDFWPSAQKFQELKMSFFILMDSESVPSGLGIPWPILAVANHFSIKTWIIDTQAGFHTCQLMLAYPLILYQCGVRAILSAKKDCTAYTVS